MNPPGLSPVQDRLIHLDVLRGFALLGILLVNFEWFIRPLQAIMLGQESGLPPADRLTDLVITTLAEGKFYPLFSMLFGAGFALMANRAIKRAAPFWAVYLRRLLVLLMFGLVHSLLVWSGDVLLVYALSALVMVLLFRNTPTRRLWPWALSFMAIPLLLMWLGTGFISLAKLGDPAAHAELMAEFAADEQALQATVAQAAEIHRSGSWTDNVVQRFDDTVFKLTYFLFWATPVIGFFLIGRWLIESDRLIHPEQHSLYFRRWRARGLIIGLAAAIVATWLMIDVNAMIPGLRSAIGVSLATLAGVMMSLGYLSAVTLAADRLRVIAPAGQMALTNYLLQSLVWTWLVYGHGLGLWGALPRWSQVPLAVLFFALQVAFSHWWLRRFRFGPVEWLWRALSYWERPAFRRDPQPGSS